MKLGQAISFLIYSVFAIIASMVIFGIIYSEFTTVFGPINAALGEFDTNAETYLNKTNSTHIYYARHGEIWKNLDKYTTQISRLPKLFLLPNVFLLLGIELVILIIVYNQPCRMGQQGNRRLDGDTNSVVFTTAVLSAGVIIAYIIAIIYLIDTARNGATIIHDLPHMLQNTRDKYPDGYGTLIERLELLINNSTDTDAIVTQHIDDRILSTNKWQFRVIIALASIASFTSLLWIPFAVIYLLYVLYLRCRNGANKVDATEMHPMIRQENNDEQGCQIEEVNSMRTECQQNDKKTMTSQSR